MERRLALRLAISLVAAGVAVGYAQAPWGFREGRVAPRFAPPVMPDGNFTFCRVMYERVRTEAMGMGWVTDYPYAEINLMTRLSELTKTPVSRDERGQPNHWVVRLTDAALFNCPFTMASDVGTIGLTPAERDGLRQYLLKGGFLWVDDFWGDRAWANWESQIGKALPPSEYPIVDLPSNHTLFHTLFNVDHVPQVPNIGLWRNFRETSERGEESATVHTRAILDHRGRVMVMMTHNTDYGDAYEREAEMPEYFKTFSVTGYALGVDILLYAMIH
jgi:Domain of unknown function (DUF4159)